jgi:hypothetical protein
VKLVRFIAAVALVLFAVEAHAANDLSLGTPVQLGTDEAWWIPVTISNATGFPGYNSFKFINGMLFPGQHMPHGNLAFTGTLHPTVGFEVMPGNFWPITSGTVQHGDEVDEHLFLLFAGHWDLGCFTYPSTGVLCYFRTTGVGTVRLVNACGMTCLNNDELPATVPPGATQVPPVPPSGGGGGGGGGCCQEDPVTVEREAASKAPSRPQTTWATIKKLYR